MKWKFEIWIKSLAGLVVGLLLWSLWASAQTNTGPATIEFARTGFTVNENSRTATLILKRTGNTNAAASVTFATANGTAIEAVDYVSTSGPVNFAAGVNEAKITIPILDNFQDDGNRTIQLTVKNPSDGAELGSLAGAELMIIDNDSVRTAWMTFGLDRVEFLQQHVLDIPLWQYCASLIYVFLAFYISKLFDFLIRGRLKKWADKTSTQFDDLLLELFRGPVKVVIFVILLHIGLRIFSWPEWMEDFLSKGLKLVVAVSLTYMALKLVDLMTGFWQQRATDESDKSFNEQLLPILRNTAKVFILMVATLLTLQNLGLNIMSLITSLGIGGLALALAAQDTLANFFGAVSVLIDKPFRIGDRVQFENVDGVVESIGFRSTQVRNLDGHLVSIPNKTIGNATITNVTQRPNIRTLINIGLTYDTPAEKVERALALLQEIYSKHPMTHDVWISFNKFADFSLNLFVVHWWKTTVYKDYLQGMQELNLTIKKRFDEEGLCFAFPTQTVYMKQDSEWRLNGGGTNLVAPTLGPGASNRPSPDGETPRPAGNN